jgi:GTP-binding protein LepA
MEGRLTRHIKIRLAASDDVYEVEDLGVLTPKPIVLEELSAGDVGFIIANIKRVADARVGRYGYGSESAGASASRL